MLETRARGCKGPAAPTAGALTGEATTDSFGRVDDLPRGPRVRITYVDGSDLDAEGGASAASRLEAIVTARVRGQRWAVRAPLLVVLAWFTVAHLRDFDYAGIYDGANLILHEAGHLLFMWGGVDVLTAAGGTLFNLVVPLLLGLHFWRRDDVFAATVCTWWAGTVLVTAAPYIADARAMVLPTVTVGPGSGIHDWNFMLGELGILERDRQVAGLFRTIGLAVLLASLAAGAWVLAVMRRAATPDDEGAGP